MNVFLNPFIPDLQPVGSVAHDVWIFIESRKSTGSSVTDIFIQKSCAFLTSLWRRENQSEAQTFEEGWNDSKMVKSLHPFLFRGRQREVFVLLLQSFGCTYCVLFDAVLPKRCPPFYL